VIIQGFKSYREQTVVEPFHPAHNVVGKKLLTVHLACFDSLNHL
jgi:hypothetical protein